MQAVNIELPVRNKKGRFSSCVPNQYYHFKIGTDFKKDKQDTLRSAAASYAKSKKWKAQTNFYETDTEIPLSDGTKKTVEAGLYIKFTPVIQSNTTENSDTAVITGN